MMALLSIFGILIVLYLSTFIVKGLFSVIGELLKFGFEMIMYLFIIGVLIAIFL